MSQIRTILLVEDNVHEAELALRALKSQEDPLLEVILTRHGREALDYLLCRGAFANRKPLDPALVILDLNLPGSSGMEVLQQIKQQERLRSIPVVVFTSSEQETNVHTCYFLGANAYVVKPGGYRQFAAVLKGMKQFWLDYNVRPVPRITPDPPPSEPEPLCRNSKF